MNKKSLYIIGNGFDIFHGIHSRFSDFKKYLLNTDPSLHNLIEEFIPCDEDWNDFEQALAEIDVDNVIDEASQFLVSYGADDWSDSYHHDYQYEISNIIDALSEQLKTRFAEWIEQLYIPNKTEIRTPILGMDKTAKYLTFNYTSTLTTAYEVPRANILFIHGEVENQNQNIVLGHAWNPSDIPSLNDVPDPESLDTRVMEGNTIINEYFGRTFKNAPSIINENQSFFSSISEISNIYILGHSLSAVDICYFEAIAQNIDTDKVRWRISYYGDDELNKHQVTMNKLGIDRAKINFCELQEI